MDARAVLFTGVDQVAVEAITVPEPQAGEVLVEVAYSCVSPGTELRCLSGKQPDAHPFPFIPGYSSVGRVIAAGEGVTLPIGTRVFSGGTARASRGIMWGGHVSHVVKGAQGVLPIPDGVDLPDAALAKLAGIAYHGVRHSRPLPHETVLVIGLGAIGQLSARLHALSGARVCAFDVSPARVALVQPHGVEAYESPEGIAATGARVLPAGADILVDATGVASVLPQVVGLARDIPWDDALNPGTRLLIQGSYPADFALPYQEAFRKELVVYIPRDSQPRDLVAVLGLMARGELRVRDLISVTAPPDDAPRIYPALRTGDLLTAVFDWGR
jgi:3-hydroxyethyl bacteriochlorophyllide a dehydrogenase